MARAGFIHSQPLSSLVLVTRRLRVMRFIALPIWLAVGIFTTLSAYAQSNKCQGVDAMHEFLIDKHQEEISGAGMRTGQEATPGSFLEIYASAKGETWTAVQVTGGMACIVDAGENWVQIPFVPPADSVVPKTAS
jgi:hypothetical protein